MGSTVWLLFGPAGVILSISTRELQPVCCSPAEKGGVGASRLLLAWEPDGKQLGLQWRGVQRKTAPVGVLPLQGFRWEVQ